MGIRGNRHTTFPAGEFFELCEECQSIAFAPAKLAKAMGLPMDRSFIFDLLVAVRETVAEARVQAVRAYMVTPQMWDKLAAGRCPHNARLMGFSPKQWR